MATLTSVPEAGAVTMTERVTLAPLARLATVGQVTTPAAWVPPLSVDPNATPAGSVSRTTTLAAPDLATARSATSVTVVVTRFAGSEPLLLVVSGSAVAASARATLTSAPDPGAVTVTVRVAVPPFARLAIRGQVTTPPDSPPPSLAETKLPPAGNVSRTTTLAAVEGPALVTTIV